MLKTVAMLLLIAGFSIKSYAVPKKQLFIDAVISQCKKTEDEASKLVRPGRSGNVMAFILCASSPVNVSADCKVNCKKNTGNVVGN